MKRQGVGPAAFLFFPSFVYKDRGGGAAKRGVVL
jgi:hypothetical protein